jgi:hypothetical protein
MKELIEKINKELKGDDWELHYGLNKAIEIIEEQESRPFDPLELGFIDVDDKDGEHDGWFINKIIENNVYRALLIHVFNDNYSLCNQKLNNEEWVYQFDIINIIKIPNHRFGKELLQNLGVIE